MNRVNRALKWVLNIPPKDKNGGQPSALAMSMVRLAVDSTKAYLCVGGPLAGQRVHNSNHGSRILTLAPRPLPDGPIVEHPKALKAKSTVYVRQTFHLGDGGERHFWVPNGQAADETLRLLSISYEARAQAEEAVAS